MYGDHQPMALMYANNLAYSAHQRFPPHMLPMMHDMSGMHSIGAQPITMGSKKVIKDKNAPKRNWTAYQFYVEEVPRPSRHFEVLFT